VLGWIISGPIDLTPRKVDIAQVSHCISDGDTNSLLRRFWEDEEIHRPLSLKKEDKQCEQHFVSTHSRLLDGRFMMRLVPFKIGSPVDIGDSLPIAIRVVCSLGEQIAIPTRGSQTV